MTDDRTKLPTGLYESDEYSIVCLEGDGHDLTADAWAFVDRIRAQERERLATAVEQGESPLPWDCDGTFAAWLRAGGDAP